MTDTRSHHQFFTPERAADPETAYLAALIETLARLLAEREAAAKSKETK